MKITGIKSVMIQGIPWTWTLVKVETDEGICGIGEAQFAHRRAGHPQAHGRTDRRRGSPPPGPTGAKDLSQPDRRRVLGRKYCAGLVGG